METCQAHRVTILVKGFTTERTYYRTHYIHGGLMDSMDYTDKYIIPDLEARGYEIEEIIYKKLR